ncbi:hypothetical protein RSOLAG1IB_10489 [Rhizoctonia solani AG-1 IB]|uniref:Uncharacterized protein n=1 Tax=Thanatephorus cucumeris (strain AG1-IB / isolate 7/3/14) TaxID=1108050 RepID=A0A0B7FYM1_THACB|nr:hypothetical protein RSOLAG1IB_10489 [Rhizoctonia solani AG-1 IB]
MNPQNTRGATPTGQSNQTTTTRALDNQERMTNRTAIPGISRGMAVNNADVLLNQELPDAPHPQPVRSSLLVSLNGHPGVFEADE